MGSKQIPHVGRNGPCVTCGGHARGWVRFGGTRLGIWGRIFSWVLDPPASLKTEDFQLSSRIRQFVLPGNRRLKKMPFNLRTLKTCFNAASFEKAH